MDFLDTLIARPSTLRVHRSLFNTWIKPYDGYTLTDMARLWLADGGLKPRSICQLISLAAQYIAWKDGEHPSQEAKELRRKVMMLQPDEPMKALTKDQAKVLMETWQKIYPEDMALLLCGLHAGLRITEIGNLTPQDLDLLRSRIVVRGLTKSGKGRIVPMSVLLEQMIIRKTDNSSRGNDQPIFESKDIGTMMNQKLTVVCKRAGLKRITSHQLRHTFATLALESGASIRTVSAILGHANVSTTCDIYWSCLDQNLDMGFLP